MTPLRIMRRIHAPLACLAIACVMSVGCQSRQEVIALGQPAEAYRADNGSVLFGYYVQPVLKPDHTGWHWLVIEPDTARLLTQDTGPDASGAIEDGPRTIAVTYKGWGRNARLIPPLTEPGRSDPAPPVVGDGGLTAMRLAWDEAMRGTRVLGADGATLALVRVSPDTATLRTRTYDAELTLNVLKIVAVGALIAGLILLGGSTEIDLN